MSTSSQGSKPSSGWQPPSLEEMQAMLPQYRFEKLLGRGGMGAVYKAVQASLDRPVAIKVLPGDLIDDSDVQFAERFKNEARTMAKMNHPSIVNVFDFGETQTGLLYFVMEFVNGTDVAQMIASQGRLPEDYALSITAHVCDALAYAHKNGIIHRDIKPANILINMDGAVKVADFGLAKQSDAGQSGLTKTNMAMGTPDFVAPEALIPGMPLDGRADLYAIGVMLYQMLTGEIPRGMWTMPGMKLGTDPRFDAIIGKAMQTDREARYQSAADLRRDLDTILTTPRAMTQAKAPAATAQPAQTAQKPPASSPRPPQGQKPTPAAAPPAAQKSRKGLFIGLGAAAAVLGCGWLFFGANGEKAKKPTQPSTAKVTPPKPSPATKTDSSPLPPPATRQTLQTLDLLALTDPIKDRVSSPNFTGKNEWRREGGELVFQPDGKSGKLAPPVAFACTDYEIEFKAVKHSGNDRIHVDVPLKNGRILPLVLNGHGRKPINERDGSTWGNAERDLHVSIRVIDGPGATDRIVIQRLNVKGNPLADWSGDLDQHAKLGEAHPDFPGQPLTSVFVMKDRYAVQTFKLRVFAGEAKVLRGPAGPQTATAAPAASTSLNPLWNGWTAPQGADLTSKWKANGAEVSTRERTTLWSPGRHENFELEVEWKVSSRSNGGIFYHVQGDNELEAFEMQLCDPANSGGFGSGSLFGVQEMSRDASKPLGQWNTAKLVVNGPRREHWINGERVCSYDLSSADFRDKLSSAKLTTKPRLDATGGRIVLQAYGGEVMYRVVRIRTLEATSGSSSVQAPTTPAATSAASTNQPASAAPTAPMPPTPPPAVANDPVSLKLAELESKFQAAFEREYKLDLAKLNTSYASALDRELAAATAAGRLDDAVALRDEKQRLADGKALPPEDLSTLPEALKRLRNTWRTAEAGYAKTRDTKGQPLFDAYDKALDTYQKELTQQNKIDDALRVKAAREELAKRRGGSAPPAEVSPTPVKNTVTAPGNEKGSSWRKAAEWVLSSRGELRIRRGGGDVTVKDAKELPGGRFDIISITIDGQDDKRPVTDDDLTRFDGMRDIDSLRMAHLTSINGSGFAAFAACAEKMKNFAVYNSPLTPENMKFITQFRNLSLLELNNIETLPSESLATIQTLKQLMHLRLLGQMKLDDKALLQLAGLTKLTDLTLPGALITDEGMVALKDMKSLIRLELSDVKGVNGPGLAHVAGASGMLNLLLSHTNVDDAAMAHVSGLTKLQALTLNQTRVTDDCIRHIASCQALQTLELGAKGITGSTLHQLSACKALSRLDLYDRTNPATTSVDDAGLQALAAAQLPSLEDLSFASKNITEAGLAHLSTMKLKKLRTNEAPSIEGLRQIAKITTLEYLEIERGDLTDEGLAVLAGLKSLQTFSSSESKITDAGLKNFESMRTLKNLALRNSQATQAGIDALKKARPDLNVSK